MRKRQLVECCFAVEESSEEKRPPVFCCLAFTVFFGDSLAETMRKLYPVDSPTAVTPGFD